MDTLAHISASATKQDDNRYLEQAMAYNDFSPARRHGILMPSTLSPKKQSRSGTKSLERILCSYQVTPSAESSIAALNTAAKSDSQETALHSSESRRFANRLSENLNSSFVSTSKIDGSAFAEMRPIQEASTQLLFDTQYATAGIASQLSNLSNDDDVLVSSTECTRPIEQQRKSPDILRSPSQAWSTGFPGAAKHSSSHASFHSITTNTSSQDQRDSQSAEVQSHAEPIELSDLVLSPTQIATQDQGSREVTEAIACGAVSAITVMERETANFQTHHQTQALPLSMNFLGRQSDGDLISSILPDTYGLSKSNDSSRLGDQFDDGLKHGDSTHLEQLATFSSRPHAVGAVLQEQDRSKLNWESALLYSLSQEYSDPNAIATTEKRVALSSSKLESNVQVQRWCEVQRADMAYGTVRDEMSHASPLDGSGADHVPDHHGWEHGSSRSAYMPALTSSPASIKDKTFMAMRVPKSTRLPPMNGHKQRHTSSPVQTEDVSPTPSIVITSEEPPRVVSPGSSTVLEALKTIPRQIFPLPAPEVADLDKSTEISTRDAHAYAAMLADKHMVYRCQKHRALSSSERGYWTFSVKSWIPSFQLQVLTELEDYFVQRTMGISTWAEVHFGADKLPEKVDVYCEAAELGNIWLFLLVLSERKLAEQDLHWIDWEGKAAVTMPSRAGQAAQAKSRNGL
jgi:hypothetical protein